MYFTGKMMLILHELGLDETDAIAYPLSNFMYVFNSDEMNADNYFMSYVYVE